MAASQGRQKLQEGTKIMFRPRERVITDTGSVSRTKQAMKKDCDINLIVERHASTGLWDHLTPTAPMYGDFSQSVELQEAIELVDAAEATFDALPANVRSVVDNDPVKFAAALADEGLFRELVEAGMPATEDPVPAPDPAPVVGGETPTEPSN